MESRTFLAEVILPPVHIISGSEARVRGATHTARLLRPNYRAGRRRSRTRGRGEDPPPGHPHRRLRHDLRAPRPYAEHDRGMSRPRGRYDRPLPAGLICSPPKADTVQVHNLEPPERELSRLVRM